MTVHLLGREAVVHQAEGADDLAGATALHMERAKGCQEPFTAASRCIPSYSRRLLHLRRRFKQLVRGTDQEFYGGSRERRHREAVDDDVPELEQSFQVTEHAVREEAGGKEFV